MPNNDHADRIKRLAERAKALDELIARTAKLQKQIVEEIERLGAGGTESRPPAATGRRRTKKR